MKSNRSLIANLFAANDALLSVLACLLVATILIAVNKHKSDADAQTDRSAGNISVYVFWQDGADLDIDTHLMGPDGKHVFFAAPMGRIWNLLRDDLGLKSDNSPRNFENAYVRGIVPGEYIINVAAYRGNDNLYPARVDVEIRVTPHPEESTGSRWTTVKTVTLIRTGDEQTVIRFTVDDDGNVIPSSVNDLFFQLAGPH